jgi:hypothetical protein
MSKSPQVMPFYSEPGIQRDITKAQSKNYIDGQWMRFYNNLPRKIGGYNAIDLGNFEIVRSMFAIDANNILTAYLGRASSLAYFDIDQDGNPDVEMDRTPIGFADDINNTWSFDLFSTTSAEEGLLDEYIVAVAAPNAMNIANSTQGIIYYGLVNATTPLIAVPNAPETSGGIVATGALLVAYGNGGVLYWCEAGDITDWGGMEPNFSVIDNTKIIYAMNTRGGGNPALICWSLNKLIRATYDTSLTIPTFIPDIIETNISIMSPASVVTFQTVTYWIGNNNFYSYTGIVQTIPNTMNSDWFFNNLNRDYQSKVWGFFNNRYNEIWWFFPYGNATECTNVLIFQPNLQLWYDSEAHRSAGLSDAVIPHPLLADNQTVSYNTGTQTIETYPIWLHEYGTDMIIQDQNYAVDSYFETHLYTLLRQSVNNYMRSRRLELDFNQTGDMQITVNNRAFSQSTPLSIGPFTFSEGDVKVDDIASQGVYVSYQIRSNTVGGYYQQGSPILNWEVGDFRR